MAGALTYYPSLPPEINTLKTWDALHGYGIKTTVTGTVPPGDEEPVVSTLRLSGIRLAEDTPLPLDAGWNLVSYLPQASLPVTQALAGIEGQYTAVHGFDGGALSFYPDLVDSGLNTLAVMEPGHGYWISTTTTVTLQYSTTLAALPVLDNSPVSLPERQPHQPVGHLLQHGFDLPRQSGAGRRGSCRLRRRGPVRRVRGGRQGCYGLMPCYLDDPTTPDVDEGAALGDTLTFTIDGITALAYPRSLNGETIDDPYNTPITWSQNLDRWKVDLYVTPLAVDLAFFTAQAEGAAVRLTWETVSEVDHVGFNLYRGPAADGPWTPLNDTLIVSPVPGSTDGQHYEWLDADPLDDAIYWYQLEALDVDSAARIVGRTSVQLGQTPPAQRIWLPLILQQPAAN